MRKRMLILTAGITAALMMSGCAPQEASKENVAVTTEAAITEETIEETEVETESEEGSEEESEGILDMTAPVRIWGSIVDVTENSMVVDNQSEMSFVGEIVFNISPEYTLVLDAQSGLPVALSDLEGGSFEAYLGPAMTMSLPPQTSPYVVIVNIPEDFRAPQYAVSTGAIIEEDGFQFLEASDGTQYPIAEDVTVEPYLTRNIVTLNDIKEGTRCLIWVNEEDQAQRIMIFPGVEADEAEAETSAEAAAETSAAVAK